MRNENNICITNNINLSDENTSESFTDRIITLISGPANTSTTEKKKSLTINVESKELRLPDNEITLIANVTSDDRSSDENQFEWTSLTQPDGSTAVKQQNAGQLQLTKLSEGLYTFKV